MKLKIKAKVWNAWMSGCLAVWLSECPPCLAAGKGNAEGEPRPSSGCSCSEHLQTSRARKQRSWAEVENYLCGIVEKPLFHCEMNKEFITQGGTPITTELATVNDLRWHKNQEYHSLELFRIFASSFLAQLRYLCVPSGFRPPSSLEQQPRRSYPMVYAHRAMQHAACCPWYRVLFWSTCSSPARWAVLAHRSTLAPSGIPHFTTNPSIVSVHCRWTLRCSEMRSSMLSSKYFAPFRIRVKSPWFCPPRMRSLLITAPAISTIQSPKRWVFHNYYW